MTKEFLWNSSRISSRILVASLSIQQFKWLSNSSKAKWPQNFYKILLGFWSEFCWFIMKMTNLCRASKVERCYVEPLLIRQSLRFTQVLTSETQFDFSSFGDGSEVSQTFWPMRCSLNCLKLCDNFGFGQSESLFSKIILTDLHTPWWSLRN